MKANELSCKDLMVGDWVKIKTYGVSDKYEKTEAYIYVKVAEIGSGLITVEYNNDIKEPYRICENTEIEPIPLTPEILEKNGFEWTTRKSYMVSHIGTVLMIWGFYKDCLSISDHSDDGGCQISSLKCRFVHQLQHALRLCGIEEKITL